MIDGLKARTKGPRPYSARVAAEEIGAREAIMNTYSSCGARNAWRRVPREYSSMIQERIFP